MARLTFREKEVKGEKIKEYIIIEVENDLRGLLNKISEFKNKPNNVQNKVFIPENLDFYEQTIDKEVDFSNCIFEKDVFFICVTFKKGVLFTNTIFNGIANFNQSIFLGEHCNFVKAKFNNQTHFERTKFHSNNTSFGKTEFNNKTFFIKAYFYNKVNIGATFNDSIRFNEAKLLGDNINFSGSTFNDNVYFQHCEFHHWVKFENTTFNKLVDFYKAKFFAPQQFHLTDFMDRAIFSDATFEKEAQFIHCKVESSSTINFHSTTFNKGLDISRSNFNLCKMSFWDVKVNGINDALSSELYKNNFEKEEYPPSVPKKLRESMRFIKNNFYAENNQIEGLEFYKKEMDIYKEEIKNPKKEKKINKPSKKDTKPKCFIEANIQSFFSAIKKKLLSILWSIISWGKNIVTWIKDQKEKYSICYYIIIVLLIILFLSLYVIYQSYWIFWGFAIFYSGTILLEIRLKNIKNAIKATNYIPPILLLLATFLLLLPIYNHFDYKNQDEIYGQFMKVKQYLSNCNISSFIDESWFPMIIYPIVFIALFLTIAFDYRDKILLCLNKKSNDFGTNWMAGVNFTILVGLVTYLPFLGYLYHINCIGFDLSSKSIGNFLQNFGELLNPLKWTNDLYIFGMKPTGWFYVWLFIGRIFIGYGYYQTIQAFRKYGKS